MSDEDAEATALLCFSSMKAAEPPSIQICIAVTPPADSSSGSAPRYFFTVNLGNVAVSLPSPLPGTQPVQGNVNITEKLPLSQDDIKAMNKWLSEILNPPTT